MTQESPQDPKSSASEAKAKGGCGEESVIIRRYPKAVFFYPMAVAAFLCGLATQLGLAEPQTLGFVFMVVFFVNLVVTAFEFSRHLSVAVILLCFVVILLGVLLNEQLGLAGVMASFYKLLSFQAGAGFYFGLCGAYVITMLGVAVDTRFDYWEIRGNEVLHHHGVLGDVERFPAPNIKLKKEIRDVFEYLLLGAGTLVIYPSGSERPIVLDNVPRIGALEDQITEKLHTLRVSIDRG